MVKVVLLHHVFSFSCVGRLVTLLIVATIILMHPKKVLVIDLHHKRMSVHLVMGYQSRRGCLPLVHLCLFLPLPLLLLQTCMITRSSHQL